MKKEKEKKKRKRRKNKRKKRKKKKKEKTIPKALNPIVRHALLKLKIEEKKAGVRGAKLQAKRNRSGKRETEERRGMKRRQRVTRRKTTASGEENNEDTSYLVIRILMNILSSGISSGIVPLPFR